MKKLLNTTYLIFFISISSLFAQSEVVFEKSTRDNFIITFQPGNRPEYQTTNFILREIARITNRNVMAVEYAINYRQDITIRKSGNKYTTIIILKDFRINGSTKIHAFDITDVLIPEQVEFYGTVSFPRSKTYSIKQSLTRLNPAETRFTFETIDSTSAGRPTYNMDELKYVYSSSNRRDFSEKATLIEEYYYSDVRLGQIFGDLSNIFAQNYKRCYEYRQMLDAMGLALSDMYQKDFANRLELYVSDPISLMPKLSNASSLLEQKIYEVDNVIMNLPIYYFNDGVRLIPININEARWHFEQALEIDPNFAPAIAQIARLEFNNGQTDLAISGVKRAYSIGSFDNDTRNLLQQLSINIDDRLIADAVQYETKREHQNALLAYLKAQDFCTSVPSLSCKDLISRGITLSRKGIYSDMMSNANNLYKSGKYDLAENAVKQAIEFQKNHSRDITNANDAFRLLNDIKEKQYARNIDQGISNLNNSIFAQALQLFEAAKEIEENFNVLKNEDLISLIKQAKRPLIVQSLEQAIRQAKSNLLSQAREVIQNASNDIYKYGFAEDDELRELLNTARLEIQSQHCINIQNQITSLLGSANEQISQQNFLIAENYFSQAKDLNDKNPDCNIDFLFVERRRAEVLPAIEYQQMLVKVDNHIKKAEYSQAIDLYNQSTNQFNHFGLNKFRLTHFTLLDFSLRQHEHFILTSISYFTSIKETKNALILLTNIEQRKFSRRKTRNVQEALGKLLAQLDHSENPTIKPKTKVKEYSKGKYFYRYLRKAYVKEFKALLKRT